MKRLLISFGSTIFLVGITACGLHTEPELEGETSTLQCDTQWSDRINVEDPRQIAVGGQTAWRHDDGHAYGFWNTFDALQACAGTADRKVHVYLPRAYEGTTQRYPVVYMNDGNAVFWPGGAANKSWRVGETLSEKTPCDIEPVIVVAVHPFDREQEYTHESWQFGRSCCGLPEYAEYMASCLKPFIDENYRTLPQADKTAFVGSSHGGLASFYTAGVRPDAFGLVGAMSPSFWVGLDPWWAFGSVGGASLENSTLIRRTRAALEDVNRRPKIWVDWGLKRDGQFHNDTIERAATIRGRDMVNLLQGSFGYVEGQDLFSFEDEIGGHDEDAWAYRFGRMIDAFYGR